jgi:hypothetical protein
VQWRIKRYKSACVTKSESGSNPNKKSPTTAIQRYLPGGIIYSVEAKEKDD